MTKEANYACIQLSKYLETSNLWYSNTCAFLLPCWRIRSSRGSKRTFEGREIHKKYFEMSVTIAVRCENICDVLVAKTQV